MKKTIKLALAAAMAMSSTAAFATNGDILIGIGAKARGMGGVGIGVTHGAESTLENPAMITSVKGTEIAFGGTIFMPDVETDLGAGYSESDADMNVIPSISIATELGNGFYTGVGMWGTAGMGVDHRGNDAAMNMVTMLQLMQFGVPLAYKTEGFSVAVTPLLQYGALDIDYDATSAFGPTAFSGAGTAQDLVFGYNFGIAYDFSQLGVDGLTLGAVYKSAIEMDYKDVLPSAGAPFIPFGVSPFSSELEQPAEVGVGVSYVIGEHTVALDLREIQYEDTVGYGDFGWENQTVIAVGYQYDTGAWAARAGYNYAENPIQEHDGSTQPGAVMNMFNLLGFPGIVESHFTLGGTYEVSKQTSFDLALGYAPEVEASYSMAGVGFGNVTTKHSQTSVSVGLNYNF